MTPEQIEQLIATSLDHADVHVKTPDGVHFEAVVISTLFQGKTLLQQHRLVNNVLREHMESQAIHALSLKTYTPERWKDIIAKEYS